MAMKDRKGTRWRAMMARSAEYNYSSRLTQVAVTIQRLAKMMAGDDPFQSAQRRDPLVVTESLGFVPDSLSVGHGPPEGRDFYKITANSSGASDTATAVLESTFTRRF
jgi:Tfp pilus assembly protein PilX